MGSDSTPFASQVWAGLVVFSVQLTAEVHVAPLGGDWSWRVKLSNHQPV